MTKHQRKQKRAAQPTITELESPQPFTRISLSAHKTMTLKPSDAFPEQAKKKERRFHVKSQSAACSPHHETLRMFLKVSYIGFSATLIVDGTCGMAGSKVDMSGSGMERTFLSTSSCSSSRASSVRCTTLSARRVHPRCRGCPRRMMGGARTSGEAQKQWENWLVVHV